MNAFHTGKYRNLFVEAGKSQSEIEERLAGIVGTFFYGSEQERIYHPVGEDMGYLEDTGNHDARTEGMSYGMMMCVQLNMQETMWMSRRQRSMCRKKSWPRPAPSAAPSIMPGMSASSFSSRVTSRSWPGRPALAKWGACRVGVAKCWLPSPPGRPCTAGRYPGPPCHR